jgi:hypothetical protein
VTPPLRRPHYFDNEAHGWAIAECAAALVDRLAGFVKPALEFKGDAHGRIWCVELEQARARLAFTSDKGDGHVQLDVHQSGWVRAQMFVADACVFRAWIEEPYEEKELWPDGADGIVAAIDEPPGRISKRGRWLQVKTADFPGAPDKGNGYWTVEDASD